GSCHLGLSPSLRRTWPAEQAMIVGIVRGREALIRLTIRGFRGRQQEIEAVVDTGYTGWLTLPPTVIAALNLRWRSVGRGILADGSVTAFDVYQAKVVWDGRVQIVRASCRERGSRSEVEGDV